MSGHTRTEVTFASGSETLAGDLVLPAGAGRHPVVLSVAGTGPQNRYGDQVLEDGTVQPHPRHHWVGERLGAAGVAQLCWDKRGVQASTGGDRRPGDPPGDRDAHASVETDLEDVQSAIEFLAEHPEIDGSRIVVMGTSAGAHFACRVAARTTVPAAYILWGGVHQDIEDFCTYIYGLAGDYAARGPEHRALVEQGKKPLLQTAAVWQDIFDAARRGEEYYEWEDQDGTQRHYLARTVDELTHPYPEQFANITSPVLVVHGDRDINVPVRQAHDSADALRAAGNPDVTLAVIRGADHGMHIVPEPVDDEEHLRRWFRDGPRGPQSEAFIHTIVGWIADLWIRQGRS